MGANVTPLDFGTEFNVSTTSNAGCGARHHCVADDASFKCWGGNGFGQLGLGDEEDRGDYSNEMGDSLSLIQFAFTAEPTSGPSTEPTSEPTVALLIADLTEEPASSFSSSDVPTRNPTGTWPWSLQMGTSASVSVPVVNGTDEFNEGASDLNETQISNVEQWLLIVGCAVIAATCLLTSGVFVRVLYSKQQEQHTAEQNIAKTVNVEIQMEQVEIQETYQETAPSITQIVTVELQSEQIENKVAETLQAATPTFDADIEFEPSLQMEGATGTAGAVVDAPATAGQDKSRAEKEAVLDWLKNEVQMEVYFSNFWQTGYESLQYIRHITGKEDLEEIGINDQEHQMHFMLHIRRLNGVEVEGGPAKADTVYMNHSTARCLSPSSYCSLWIHIII